MITLPIVGFVFAILAGVIVGAISLLMGIMLQEQRQEFRKMNAEFEEQQERVKAKIAAGGRQTSGRIMQDVTVSTGKAREKIDEHISAMVDETAKTLKRAGW